MFLSDNNFKRFQADKQIQPIRFILGKLTVKRWMIYYSERENRSNMG